MDLYCREEHGESKMERGLSFKKHEWVLIFLVSKTKLMVA